MNKDEILDQLYADYTYLRAEIEDLKEELTKGRITESKANGMVKHPNVVILDTYMKQLINIVKQIDNLSSDNSSGSSKMLSKDDENFMESISKR